MSGANPAASGLLALIEHYARAAGIETTYQPTGSELAYKTLTCSLQEAASMEPPGGKFASEKNSVSSERRSAQDQLDEEAIRKLPWCDFSEARLCKLVFETRVENKLLDMEKLRKALNEIRNDETLGDAYFVQQDYQKEFIASVSAREKGEKVPVQSYPPIYTIRPSLLQVEKKLHEFYTKECVEKNMAAPANQRNTKKAETQAISNVGEKENETGLDKETRGNVKVDQKKNNNKNGRKKARK